MVGLCAAISVLLDSWDRRCSFLHVVKAFSRNMEELDVAFAEMRRPGVTKTSCKKLVSCHTEHMPSQTTRFYWHLHS